MAGHVKWGIVGTGGIAGAMVDALAEVGSPIVAVGSRSEARAEDFVTRHRLAAGPGSVADVVAARPDVVYVASANHHHVPDARACLEAGVPVLCEKPLSTDLAGARAIVDAAGDTFLMEAMWMRFLPWWELVHRLLDEGRVGSLRTIRADFGVLVDPSPDRRWFDPVQGGGALLDVGIYPVTLAHLLAGPPTDLAAVRTLTATRVDAQTAVSMVHAGEVVSSITCSFVSDSDLTAVIAGSEGRLVLAAPFHRTPRIEHWRGGDLVDAWDTSFEGSGYAFEVREVERCLGQGLVESPNRPWSDTLAVMEILDAIAGAR